MAFTKKNVTRSKYTRAKRVKRVKKTSKRRSQKCVKGGNKKIGGWGGGDSSAVAPTDPNNP